MEEGIWWVVGCGGAFEDIWLGGVGVGANPRGSAVARSILLEGPTNGHVRGATKFAQT